MKLSVTHNIYVCVCVLFCGMVLENFIEQVLNESDWFGKIKASADRVRALLPSEDLNHDFSLFVRDCAPNRAYLHKFDRLRPAFYHQLSGPDSGLWTSWHWLIQNACFAPDGDELKVVAMLLNQYKEGLTFWDVFWGRLWGYLHNNDPNILQEILCLRNLPRSYVNEDMFIDGAHCYMKHFSDAHLRFVAGVASSFGIQFPDPRVSLISSKLDRPLSHFPRPPSHGPDGEINDPVLFTEYARRRVKRDLSRAEDEYAHLQVNVGCSCHEQRGPMSVGSIWNGLRLNLRC